MTMKLFVQRVPISELLTHPHLVKLYTHLKHLFVVSVNVLELIVMLIGCELDPN